ncbi:MAG: multicopper oxidase domain-containing protein [Rhodocyclales bacterium]|nr:multicopper oxidase domain-containing protein [Rhodocyclales bacterium]
MVCRKLIGAIAVALALVANAGIAATRHYYIAAEDVIWDFAPSNRNLMHCHDPGGCPIPDPWTASHVFNKVRYIEYSDASFIARTPQPPWLGVLGPIIRAEEGDTVIVRFCNKTTSPDPATGEGRKLGMHPHGFRYTKDNEGAHYLGVNSHQAPGAGSAVAPGECFDYRWEADRDSAPGDGEASSKVWWYHSHLDEAANVNAGLLGPIIITKEGKARRDGSPKDVDREFVVAFMIFNELDGEEPGLMHAMNGYIFGNLTGLVMKNGERVRWHVLGMGNELDNHSAHWHGKTLTIGRHDAARRTDVIELMPASMVTADMKADNPGEWMFHCHVADHIDAGMITSYEILP